MEILRDLVSRVYIMCVRSVEGPRDGALGRVRAFRVINRVDQQREPQNVGQRNKFESLIRADFPYLDQEPGIGYWRPTRTC